GSGSGSGAVSGAGAVLVTGAGVGTSAGDGVTWSSSVLPVGWASSACLSSSTMEGVLVSTISLSSWPARILEYSSIGTRSTEIDSTAGVNGSVNPRLMRPIVSRTIWATIDTERPVRTGLARFPLGDEPYPREAGGREQAHDTHHRAVIGAGIAAQEDAVLGAVARLGG